MTQKNPAAITSCVPLPSKPRTYHIVVVLIHDFVEPDIFRSLRICIDTDAGIHKQLYEFHYTTATYSYLPPAHGKTTVLYWQIIAGVCCLQGCLRFFASVRFGSVGFMFYVTEPNRTEPKGVLCRIKYMYCTVRSTRRRFRPEPTTVAN